MRSKLLIGILLIWLSGCASPEPSPDVSIEFAWAYRAGDYVRSKPTAYQDAVYVGGDDNQLHAVDAATGEPRKHVIATLMRAVEQFSSSWMTTYRRLLHRSRYSITPLECTTRYWRWETSYPIALTVDYFRTVELCPNQ